MKSSASRPAASEETAGSGLAGGQCRERNSIGHECPSYRDGAAFSLLPTILRTVDLRSPSHQCWCSCPSLTPASAAARRKSPVPAGHPKAAGDFDAIHGIDVLRGCISIRCMPPGRTSLPTGGNFKAVQFTHPAPRHSR